MKSRRWSPGRAALLLVGALVLSAAVFASADDQAAELQRLREENARLRERIDALEGRPAAPAPAPSPSGEPPAAATDVVVTRSVPLHKTATRRPA
jgi:hypothetical protein